MCLLLRKNKDVDEVTRFISQISGVQAIEFARYLIAEQAETSKIDLPEALELKILDQKLVSSLLAIYLNDECS